LVFREAQEGLQNAKLELKKSERKDYYKVSLYSVVHT